MRSWTSLTLGASGLSWTLMVSGTALADTVVQIPVDSILDGRSVSTLTGGMVVPYGAGFGVYSDGADGYATAAVQTMLAPTSKGVGLPDDGLFPATGNLPAFQLHFSNAAPSTSLQTRQIHINKGPQSFMFPVPAATYSSLYLILTSSEGAANLTITLSYAGGAPNTTTTVTGFPDTGLGVQTGGYPHFYIITNTGKWAGNTDVEPTGHTIGGITITPSPAPAILTGVQIAKTNAAHVVFWAATGIATSPVDAGVPIGTDAGIGSSGATASDAGGASGSSAGATSGTSSGTTSSGTAGSGSSSGSGAGSGTSASTGTSATSGTVGGTGSAGSGSVGSAGTTGGPGSGSASAGTTASTGAGSPQSGAASSGASAASAPSSSSGCSLSMARNPKGALWLPFAALFGLLVRRRHFAKSTRPSGYRAKRA